jgi:hypothetical protein
MVSPAQRRAKAQVLESEKVTGIGYADGVAYLTEITLGTERGRGDLSIQVRRTKRAPASASLRQWPDGKNLARMEAFDLRLSNGHDRDRLPQRIEHLQDASLRSALRVRDVINQRRHIPSLEAMLGKVSL